MLELKNVSVGPCKILDNVNIAFCKGITAVIGVNSAGKSTLLKAASGEISCDGEVLLNGKNIKSYKSKQKADILAFLPQVLPSPSLTVREVVGFAFYKEKVRLSENERLLVDQKLAEFGALHLADRVVSSLSGGERQKVFLCMVLLQNANVLLLDEPTTYMDIAFKPTLYKALRSEAEKGKTVVAVMHDLSDAVEIADNIALISNGKLAFYGSKQECLEQGIIEKEFSVERFTLKTGEEEIIMFK